MCIYITDKVEGWQVTFWDVDMSAWFVEVYLVMIACFFLAAAEIPKPSKN